MNNGQSNLDVGAILNIAEPLVLDVITWFKRRQSEGATPQDDEVKAYVKGKLTSIISEADAFEAEGPTTPTT